jgi:hypothetical protein
MNLITTITEDAAQKVSVVLEDGTLMTLELLYRPGVQRWFFSIAHPLLTLSGMMLAEHPNLLRPWRNLISFGLACMSSDGLDPVDIADFANGRIQLFTLNASEIGLVESDILEAVA